MTDRQTDRRLKAGPRAGDGVVAERGSESHNAQLPQLGNLGNGVSFFLGGGGYFTAHLLN